jgi:ATP-dependent RNA helicase DeaD
VIHVDLPNDHETLLHRSGRTGRAGRKGVCVMMVPYTRRRKAERLIDMAGIDATWAAPPSAEEVRVRDRERLMHDPMFTEETTEEDLAIARMLLTEKSAEDIANALARFHRARLPAPEEIFDPGPDRGPRERKDKRERETDRPQGGRDKGRGSDESYGSSEDMVWFRMSVGRNNADPRWLLPIICRLGHVTKKEIGSIKIFDRETKFQIAQSHASKFAASTRKANDEDIRIEPAEGPQGKSSPGKSSLGKSSPGKPWGARKPKDASEGGFSDKGPREKRDFASHKGPRSDKGPKEGFKGGKPPRDHKGPKKDKFPKDNKRSTDNRS